MLLFHVQFAFIFVVVVPSENGTIDATAIVPSLSYHSLEICFLCALLSFISKDVFMVFFMHGTYTNPKMVDVRIRQKEKLDQQSKVPIKNRIVFILKGKRQNASWQSSRWFETRQTTISKRN